jgi:hypothetical protein
MTDRDTFAAAALTGLLTKDDAAKPESMAPWWPEWVCDAAYRWADAMLRERGNHSEKPNSSTNHDAVPEARARDADRVRTDKATTRPGDGTGNTSIPESYDKGDEKRTNTDMNRTIDRKAYEGDLVSRLRHWRGLHLAHSGDLFDEAADEIARLREAIRRLAEQDATLSAQGGNVTVTMDATLTDEERTAVEAAIAWMAPVGNYDFRLRTTLQSLLKRLK